MPETVAAPATPAASATPAAEDKTAAAAALVAKAEPKKFKVEFPEIGEIEIPEADITGVLAQFAKMTAADLEAKRWREEIEPMLDDDAQLEALLRKRGKNPEKFAEALLSKTIKDQVEAAKLSPEQKRIKELEAERDRDRAEAKARIDKERQVKFEAEVKVEYEKLKTLATDALAQTSLPKEVQDHPETLRRLGALMKRNAELEYDVSPLVLAKQLEAAMLKEHDYVFSKFSSEALYKRIGRKGVEALIKMYAAEMAPKADGLPAAAAVKPRKDAETSPEELRREARRLQSERVQEELRLTRGGASGRTNRFYGSK